MDNSVQIFRRFKSVQGFIRIINSNFCKDHKDGHGSAEKVCDKPSGSLEGSGKLRSTVKNAKESVKSSETKFSKLLTAYDMQESNVSFTEDVDTGKAFKKADPEHVEENDDFSGQSAKLSEKGFTKPALDHTNDTPGSVNMYSKHEKLLKEMSFMSDESGKDDSDCLSTMEKELTEDLGRIENSAEGDSNQLNETQSDFIEEDAIGDSTSSVPKTDEGFLAAYKKQEEIVKDTDKKSEPVAPQETFTSLLRESPFIQLGNPVGKIVIGKIYHSVNDDLYIDFGWKFPAVCSKPKNNPEKYNLGATVILKINDLELSTKFLGETKYISLLEADCKLIGYLGKKDAEEEGASKMVPSL